MSLVGAFRSRPRSGGAARRAGRAALLLALALAWYLTLAPNSLGGPVGVVWVSGTSMEPTMHTGDLAVLYERSSYGVGDVVAFEIPGGGTVIHRIIEVSDRGYRFQGDNRDFADPWLLDEDSIIGEQVALVPRAGAVVTLLGQPPVMAISVAVMALLWAIGRRADDGADATTDGAVPDDAGIVRMRLPSRWERWRWTTGRRDATVERIRVQGRIGCRRRVGQVDCGLGRQLNRELDRV